MNDNQEYEEQTRKLDQFHDKYHQQKQPNWLNTKVEAEGEGAAKTGTYDVARRTVEIDGQKQEDIRKHLEGVIKRMEQVVDSPVEVTVKRIEVDAATIAVLAIVSELLPEQIQEQLRTIITLHEKTWQIDMPAVEGETLRKPLSEELIETISHEDDSSIHLGNS